jgi:alkylation response protein AidB-like acyl-CoA dehydrogenase
VGITKNALRDAIEYTRTKKRPWIHSGVEKGADDPYALLTIGQMEAWTEAVDALQERAVDALDATEANPTPESRAATMIAVARAKAVSTDVGLRVCEALFQVTGAASTLAKYSYDRHWRNLRTITLHDPSDYKYRLVGDYVLNDRWPEISTYT